MSVTGVYAQGEAEPFAARCGNALAVERGSARESQTGCAHRHLGGARRSPHPPRQDRVSHGIRQEESTAHAKASSVDEGRPACAQAPWGRDAQPASAEAGPCLSRLHGIRQEESQLKSKISGVACSLRISVCVGRDAGSLLMCFEFVMGSLWALIPPRNFFWTFGLNLDESCIFVRSNLSLSAPNLGVLCTPDRPPRFCLVTCRRSRTSRT